MNEVRTTAPRSKSEFLNRLCNAFYESPGELGEFIPVADHALPTPYASLLAHNHHMTVAVEQYHGCEVDVKVLERKVSPTDYARTILLTRQTDGCVVQFGIMRVMLGYLAPHVRAEIESESVPLGRVLIRHHVMRQVELVGLYRVNPMPPLSHLLNVDPQVVTFGRTARIHVAGEPAVELLEIVTPVG